MESINLSHNKQNSNEQNKTVSKNEQIELSTIYDINSQIKKKHFSSHTRPKIATKFFNTKTFLRKKKFAQHLTRLNNQKTQIQTSLITVIC